MRVSGENEPKWRLRFEIGIGHRFGHAFSLIQVFGFVRTVAATEEFAIGYRLLAIGYFVRAFGENDPTIRWKVVSTRSRRRRWSSIMTERSVKPSRRAIFS